MNKLVYASIVKELIEKKGIKATIVENCRNNCCMVGLRVNSSDTLSPVFYILDEEERSPEDFADYCINFVPDKIDTDRLSEIMLDKNEILKRSHYILVNSKLNEKNRSIVRVPVNETLEMHYKIDVSDVFKDTNIVVDYSHLTKNNITEEEFVEAAYNNTKKKYPLSLMTMGETLGINGFNEMLILTNKIKTFGAGAILYKGVYKKLKERVGDFILLPSSVHEWIVVPNGLGPDIMGITNIIREVNRTVVSCEEVLSDRPYKLTTKGQLVAV